MKILVIGGNGFVGSNVVAELNMGEHEIISLSKSSGLDLLNYEQAKNEISRIKPNIVINLAAKVGSLNYVTQQAADVFDQNMRMLLNLYRLIQEVIPNSILINPIANCAYPGHIVNYSENLFWEGKVHQSVLAYGNTRRMIEILSECYTMQYDFKSINFYVPNMYGPKDSTDPNKAHALNALISKVIKAKYENKTEFDVWGSGIAIREWLYVEDYARILVYVINNLDSFVNKQPINIAQNYGLSIKELLDIIVKKTEFQGKIIWDKNMPDGAPIKVMDDTLFKESFVDFSFTELDYGIEQTIKYYEEVYPY